MAGNGQLKNVSTGFQIISVWEDTRSVGRFS